MTGSNNCTKQHYHCATCTFVVTLFMSVENSLRMLMTIVEVKIAYMSMDDSSIESTTTMQSETFRQMKICMVKIQSSEVSGESETTM